MKLSNRIRNALTRDHAEDRITDYLNQSVSREDLERRQREVDQGKFRPWRYTF